MSLIVRCPKHSAANHKPMMESKWQNKEGFTTYFCPNQKCDHKEYIPLPTETQPEENVLQHRDAAQDTTIEMKLRAACAAAQAWPDNETARDIIYQWILDKLEIPF